MRSFTLTSLAVVALAASASAAPKEEKLSIRGDLLDVYTSIRKTNLTEKHETFSGTMMDRKVHIKNSWSCDAVNDRVRDTIVDIFKGIRDDMKKAMPSRGGFRGSIGFLKKTEVDIDAVRSGLKREKYKYSDKITEGPVKGAYKCGFRATYNDWKIKNECKPISEKSPWYYLFLNSINYSCKYSITLPKIDEDSYKEEHKDEKKAYRKKKSHANKSEDTEAEEEEEKEE